MNGPVNLSIQRAAEWLGASPKTVRRKLANREIEFFKVGTRVMIPLKSLEDFVKRNTVPTFDKQEFRRDVRNIL